MEVAAPGLSPDGLAMPQRVAGQSGARFADAAYLPGGLDPDATPAGWLAAAQACRVR